MPVPMTAAGAFPRSRSGRLAGDGEPHHPRSISAFAERTLGDLRCWERIACSLLLEGGEGEESAAVGAALADAGGEEGS